MKKTLKAALACFIAVVAILGLVACASGGGGNADAEDKELTIGILFDFLAVESRVRQRDFLENYAKELGVTLVFQSAEGDEKTQMQQAENLITQGVDALGILAQNADASKPIAQAALEAGIPFIVIDRPISDTDVDYFVGINMDAIGIMQIEYFLDLYPSGNWAFIAGAATDPLATIWLNTWMERIQPYLDSGDINLVANERVNNWDPTIALKLMENILTANDDDISVVMVMNDGMGTGVYQAIEARGLSGQILMSGLDGETTAFQRIVEGKQAMTVAFSDDDIAKAVLDTAVAAASGQTVVTNGVLNNGFKDVPAFLVEPFVVDITNIDKDIIATGMSTIEEVYANIPRDQWPSIP